MMAQQFFKGADQRLERLSGLAERPVDEATVKLEERVRVLPWVLGITASLLTAGMVGLITLVLTLQRDMAVIQAQLVSLEKRLEVQQVQNQRYLEMQVKYLESLRE